MQNLDKCTFHPKINKSFLITIAFIFSGNNSKPECKRETADFTQLKVITFCTVCVWGGALLTMLSLFVFPFSANCVWIGVMETTALKGRCL